MKRAGLLILNRTLLAFTLILVGLQNFSTPFVQAATIGTGNCVQNVDSASDVAVVQAGGYCYVAFSAGTRIWTTPSNVSSIDYLVVAGGGSGGARHGGGGGAGGLLKGSGVSVSNITSLSVTVGAGGAAVTPPGNPVYATGLPGGNSTLARNVGAGSFSTIQAIGGGGGEAGGAGSQGGGSGGGTQSTNVSSGTLGQGNNGGTGGTGTISGISNWWAGGGGGAGSAGTNGVAGSGGNGGSGAIWFTSFTTTIATSLGLPLTNQSSGGQVYFAGGGGGAITLSYTQGGGGLGGGGAAAEGNYTGTSGTPNSGGGGGGTGCCNGGTTGAGGSGVVLIRYSLPTFTNTSTFSIAENTSTSTNAATINVSESSTITIRSISDYSFFTIVISDSVTARIRFINSPDYEAFADSGGNSEYDITVRATNTAGNYQDLSIKITVTNANESATINAPTISSTLYKGVVETITVTINVAGKVRFFVGGKRISTCKDRVTSGSYPNNSAICLWKPPVTGRQVLTATLTPTDSTFSSSTSAPTIVQVQKRTTAR